MGSKPVLFIKGPQERPFLYDTSACHNLTLPLTFRTKVYPLYPLVKIGLCLRVHFKRSPSAELSKPVFSSGETISPPTYLSHSTIFYATRSWTTRRNIGPKSSLLDQFPPRQMPTMQTRSIEGVQPPDIALI